MKLPLLLAIWLVWFFEHGFRDTAEATSDGGVTWTIVGGPYVLDASGTHYRINIDGRSGQLFRVRRDYGIPWL